MKTIFKILLFPFMFLIIFLAFIYIQIKDLAEAAYEIVFEGILRGKKWLK